MRYKIFIFLSVFFLVATIVSAEDTGPVLTDCNGCISGTTCLPFGVRIDNDSGKNVYCSYDGKLKMQISSGNSCDYNYECQSDQCIEGVCEGDAERTVQKVKKDLNWWERLVLWFANLF